MRMPTSSDVARDVTVLSVEDLDLAISTQAGFA